MPFPNEHAARVRSPGDFQPGSFRRISRKVTVGGSSKTVIIIIGRPKGQSTTASQSFRFPRQSWTAAQARQWATAHGAKRFEPATGLAQMQCPSAVILATGTRQAFKSLGDAAQVDGQPRQRFEHDLLRIGRFELPNQGLDLVVSSSDLDLYLENFRRFQVLGIKVPVTVDHGHEAEHLRGELLDMRRDGDWLKGTIEFVGQAAIDMAGQPAAEISLELDLEHKTSDGEDLGKTITGVSVVQHPAVAGQGEFAKIAASRGHACLLLGPVLTMSISGDSQMKNIIKFCRDELKAEIKDDADEAAVITAIEMAIEAAAATEPDEETKTKLARLSEVEEENKTLKLAAKPIELSREMVVLSKKSLKQSLDTLVTRPKPAITPAVRDKLEPLLSTMAMLSVADGADGPNYEGITNALAENDLVVLGEKTKGQHLTLQRDDGTVDRVDPDLPARIAEAHA